MKDGIARREDAPAVIRGGKADFAEVAGESYPVRPADVAGRVKAHLAAAALFGRLSLAHAIAAGWLLHSHRLHTPHGSWQAWCRDALGVSRQTADNYIGLFMATVGAARNIDGVPLENSVSPRELEFATCGMEDKSVTRAMVDLGVVRRSGKWGGDRREAAAANGHAVGRPAKDAAEEVEAAAKDPDLNWAEVSGYLKGIREFAVEADGFGTLADDDLESAVVILTEAAERARTLLAARREGEG